jgi:hypothetical protein
MTLKDMIGGKPYEPPIGKLLILRPLQFSRSLEFYTCLAESIEMRPLNVSLCRKAMWAFRKLGLFPTLQWLCRERESANERAAQLLKLERTYLVNGGPPANEVPRQPKRPVQPRVQLFAAAVASFMSASVP